MSIPPVNLVIRKVNITDLPRLEWDGEYAHFRRLYQEVYTQSLTRKAVMWLAEDPSHHLMGQLFIQLKTRRVDLADGRYRAYLFGFRVKPEYQNQGVGHQMLLKAEQDLIHRRFRRVCLNVIQTNPRARQFYQRYGYQVLGPDAGIWNYQDNDGLWHNMEEPAWRMEKELVQSISLMK